jgi:hypothetical protein
MRSGIVRSLFPQCDSVRPLGPFLSSHERGFTRMSHACTHRERDFVPRLVCICSVWVVRYALGYVVAVTVIFEPDLRALFEELLLCPQPRCSLPMPRLFRSLY